jgi:hypothetical protein
MFRLILISALLAACADDTRGEGRSALGTPGSAWMVIANADGSFTPSTLHVRSGDSVTWSLTRGDTVVPIGTNPDVCNAALPYSASGLTGPTPVAPGGLFTINPPAGPQGMDRGLVEVSVPLGTVNPCGAVAERARAVVWPLVGFPQLKVLCASGARGASMASTWQDPDLSGVFIRVLWNAVHIGPGQYDFTMLDAELEQAMSAGKLYSLVFTAGRNGTPAWIFDVGGVPRVSLQDNADDDQPGCGQTMDLGPPHDAMYQQHYFDMLTAVAAHLKSRADWYRALAYIKPSGANMFTSENRLPKRCEAGCFCNTEAWSLAGYESDLLEDFFSAQEAVLVREYPGKTLSYQEIHAGFPRVNEVGGYVNLAGVLTAGAAEIGGTAQTQAILDRGQDEHQLLFASQHNGLQPKPTHGCPNGPGESGCPQDLVVQEGVEGQYIGFQTQNTQQIVDSSQLASALQNGWDNSTAGMIEIYEERLWEARVLRNLDIATWDRDFRDRRAQQQGGLRDLPSHSHVFVRTVGGSKGQVHTYINGTRCDPANPHTATIIVDA